VVEHPSLVRLTAGLIGWLLKNDDATRHDLTHEYFVVKFDGLITSGHRRFVDALKAGLLLRDQFPQHDVKVDAIQISDSTEDRVLH
jgi:hypothetical protein